METVSGFGWLSLIPPAAAILLCFITRRVIISLFIGVFAGGLIYTFGNPLLAVEYSLDKIIGSITDDWNARLLVFNLLMGSGVAFIWRLGGSRALTQRAEKAVKTRKQAGLGAWGLGILVFFNDYVNAAIVGNVFRDIFDKLRISREKLSYILDSTAAPVATFFISDWIAFQIGMIQSGMDAANITEISAFQAYLYSIPLNLYCIIAVLLVGIVIITGRDFSLMSKAEKRTLETGKVVRDGASPMMDVEMELGEEKDTKPKLSTFFLPLAALVAVTLFGFWWTGREGNTLIEVLSNTDPAKALLWGAFAMTITGMGIAFKGRIMKVAEVMGTFLDGMKLMLMACTILVLAWSLGTVTKDLKQAEFIINILGDSLSYDFLPLIVFIMGMVIAFSTGTSWGAMTILTPIAIPLAWHVSGDVYLTVVSAGAVFSGAIFGDHCSPISDTTVLASIFSGSDHMDHVSTQIPYAITGAGVAAVLYLLFGVWNLSPAVLIPLGILLSIILIYIFGKKTEGTGKN